MVLCLVNAMRTMNNLFTPAVQGVGAPQVQLGNIMFALLVMAPSIYLGAHMGGAIGLSLAWLIAYSVIFFVTGIRSANAIDVWFSVYLRAILPSATASIGMFLLVLVFTDFMGESNSIVTLIGGILIGVLSYTTLIWVLDRHSLSDVLRLIKG